MNFLGTNSAIRFVSFLLVVAVLATSDTGSADPTKNKSKGATAEQRRDRVQRQSRSTSDASSGGAAAAVTQSPAGAASQSQKLPQRSGRPTSGRRPRPTSAIDVQLAQPGQPAGAALQSAIAVQSQSVGAGATRADAYRQRIRQANAQRQIERRADQPIADVIADLNRAREPAERALDPLKLPSSEPIETQIDRLSEFARDTQNRLSDQQRLIAKVILDGYGTIVDIMTVMHRRRLGIPNDLALTLDPTLATTGLPTEYLDLFIDEYHSEGGAEAVAALSDDQVIARLGEGRPEVDGDLEVSGNLLIALYARLAGQRAAIAELRANTMGQERVDRLDSTLGLLDTFAVGVRGQIESNARNVRDHFIDYLIGVDRFNRSLLDNSANARLPGDPAVRVWPDGSRGESPSALLRPADVIGRSSNGAPHNSGADRSHGPLRALATRAAADAVGLGVMVAAARPVGVVVDRSRTELSGRETYRAPRNRNERMVIQELSEAESRRAMPALLDSYQAELVDFDFSTGDDVSERRNTARTYLRRISNLLQRIEELDDVISGIESIEPDSRAAAQAVTLSEARAERTIVAARLRSSVPVVERDGDRRLRVFRIDRVRNERINFESPAATLAYSRMALIDYIAGRADRDESEYVVEPAQRVSGASGPREIRDLRLTRNHLNYPGAVSEASNVGALTPPPLIDINDAKVILADRFIENALAAQRPYLNVEALNALQRRLINLREHTLGLARTGGLRVMNQNDAAPLAAQLASRLQLPALGPVANWAPPGVNISTTPAPLARVLATRGGRLLDRTTFERNFRRLGWDEFFARLEENPQTKTLLP